MTRHRLILAALSLLVMALAACASEGSSGTHVDVAEFWITPENDVLNAGTVDLTVENYGDFSHTLVVSDSTGAVLAATDLIAPDTEAILTVDLVPGTYTLTCRIVFGLEDGTVVDHYQQGMVATVEVIA